MSNISPLAHVHPNAKIGESVVIEPFAFVDDNVEIGDGTLVMSNANIRFGARIGKNCRIFPGAVISAIPQDLKFVGEDTLAIVGDNTTVRECATVNRGTKSRGETRVGNNCLLMAYSHLAHDCIVKNNVIIGNATQVAGEVEIDDFAILSGGCLVHQFTCIGRNVMVQGGSRIGKDLPPFIMAGREPISYVGLNSVGLRRHQFTSEQINEIQEVYRYVYQAGYNTTDALRKIEEELPESELRNVIVGFIRASKRGIVRGYFG